jgi:hypothetical protein
MTEQKFKSEMRRAEVMRGMAEPMMAEYYAGYIRGLRRAYHGDDFGTLEEHDLWIEAINSVDESRKQRGIGYRDGLAFGELSSRMGRPSISTEAMVSITLRLPVSVRDSIPEPRGEWVRDLITKNLAKK